MAVTNLSRRDLDRKDRLQKLVDTLFSRIPTGVGSKGPIKLNRKELEKVLTRGAKWAVDRGFGEPEDLIYTEARGCMDGADPTAVSDKALTRGGPQQGTLGSGNHFIEVQYVDEVYDPAASDAFGIHKGQIAVMVHSGSRGFGHQVCTDSLEIMNRAVNKYRINLPDRQLACAPFRSPEGQDYWKAMQCAANYAWANRQCLMHWVREALEDFLQIGPADLAFRLVYDIAHNIVKLEDHDVDGANRTLAVHRKGATRAFPPGHAEVPERYRPYGQPVIIPGDMGTSSYLLRGTEGGMRETFGSSCHGAGRVLSRSAAIKKARGRTIREELENRGIFARSAGRTSLMEEMPDAYKDVSAVVEVVHRAGIASKVARMRPLCVIKG
jgi:tRNA-splicing ligase RtcB